MFKLLLICGGPSPERGISLNSARSIYDNIGNREEIEVEVIFVDYSLNKYFVDETFLYSNTTSDFDFKLESECKKLSEEEFLSALKSSDLVFPILHGNYGEDGTIQKILEENGVLFVASSSKACKKMYNKANAQEQILEEYGFYYVPKMTLYNGDDIISKMEYFFGINNLHDVVIKPVEGGSSIGVEYAGNIAVAIKKSAIMLEENEKVIVEKYCHGQEFTVIILQNDKGEPTALIPTEIEVKSSTVGHRNPSQKKEITDLKDQNKNNLFTTRRKYLPTNETHYYAPPRFSKDMIATIRRQAENLFELVGAKDFLRIDGWLLENDEIYFSDFNPISGMEQNSFIFQQGAKIGLTHKKMIDYILKNSAKRQNLEYPIMKKNTASKKRVNVILGGVTSERQVSLMSGSNVWLKLMNSEIYEPFPYLMTEKDGKLQVLELSYDLVLNHTVEEIIYQHATPKDEIFENNLINEIHKKLGVLESEIFQKTQRDYVSLAEFIESSKKQNAYVFLGLHGGFGEDGSIQKMLEDAGLEFNGSGSKASELCMDKFKTGNKVNSLGIPRFRTAKKVNISVEELKKVIIDDKAEELWKELIVNIGGENIVVKPQCDGCSTGVVVLTDINEFKKYIDFFINGEDIAESGNFKMHSGQITIGINNEKLIFEEYIDVDKLNIINGKIYYKKPVGWIELTIGVFENRGDYHALNPSITVADSGVLSLEEKFQGGTGVNITPPPEYIIDATLVNQLKSGVEKLCKEVEIKDYCRIDVFVNQTTKEIIIIEINTLPGLSPSTVLFQQGAKEVPSMNPLKLLERIIEE